NESESKVDTESKRYTCPQIIRFIEVLLCKPHFLFFGLTLTQIKRMVSELLNTQSITAHVKNNDFLNLSRKY
ncbi:hypothetical protein VKX94_10630, partial [Lactobacillus helveticus]|uniref:hypothetical protein n=1 Tax=Lactobacillus helveticus TaxID=1587 RepID=UPI002B467018